MRQAFDGLVVRRSVRQRLPLWAAGGAMVLAAGIIVTSAAPSRSDIAPVTAAHAEASGAGVHGDTPVQVTAPVASAAARSTVSALWVSRPVHVAGPSPATAAAVVPTPVTPMADSYPLALAVPERVRLIDGSAFRLGEDRYRLTSLDAVGVVQGCAVTRGRRCISHPRRALREAIAGRTLHCRLADQGSGRETMVTCRQDASTVAALP